MAKSRKLILPGKLVLSDATFSKCKRYRYSLRRAWDPTRLPAVFVCLNPSTAGAKTNDPTVIKCVHFAYTWGYGGMTMLNLFALRSTDPKNLRKVEDPVGPDHDVMLTNFLGLNAGIVICAWGEHGVYLNRHAEVLAILEKYGPDPHCLEVNKSGQPKHPLYIRSDRRPIPFPYTTEV